ncbi:MAG: ABC transporter ATP-binding protein [Armatimonadota bacterium]|nr:ABC transporter ATP-binding protein [Armatimonadota bacterium]MDR5698015.1 ABC transporter ATP-binding protein [Armatimonadota bacterium]
MTGANELLQVTDLRKYFPVEIPRGSGSGVGAFVKAVDGVSFTVHAGETLGLVGESGSGKSTVAYTVIGMYRPTGGKIFFRGQDIGREASRRHLGLKKDIQIVFQDPGSSLNPRRTIRQILELPLRVHGLARGRREVTERVADLLETVELSADYMDKYPPAIGGGERQMVAIARALATNPALVILDEPTSALDVSVQAKVVRLLMRLQREFGLTYLFITHDLSLMRNVASRVAIMYLGKIAEVAPTDRFFAQPLHPYTQMLLSAIPVATEAEEAVRPRKVVSRGEIPSPVNVPTGCSFHPRCPMVMEICKEIDPVAVEAAPSQWVRCHLYYQHRVRTTGRAQNPRREAQS